MPNLVSPSRLSDVGVKPVSFDEYQQEAQKRGLAQALAQAQIMQAQAAAMKESRPDIEDLGKQAFMKAATGKQISPEESAALQYLDSKSQNYSFNPVTGNMEAKPSLLDRAGVSTSAPTPFAPPRRDMSPTESRNMPISTVGDSKTVELYGNDGQPVDNKSEWDIAFEKEMAAAKGNKRLQQVLKENYAKSKISMNEAEAKAAGFADRMLQSNPIIDEKTSAGTSPKQRVLGALPLLGNYVVSDDYQSFNQAQRDFINAQLRRESGAVISPAEFDNAEKQYFPVPGDERNPAIIAQKKANRDAAVKAMQRSAGPAYKSAVIPTNKITAAPRNVADRKVGAVYSTPSGNLKWTGTGWLPAN